MKKVFKYPFHVTTSSTVYIPHGSPLRHVGLDPTGTPCVWAEVDPDAKPAPVQLFVVGTGHPIPKEAVRHLGSFVQKPFVWHVYTTA